MFRTMQYLGTLLGYRQNGPVSHDLKKRFYYPVPLKEVVAETQRGNRINYEKAGLNNKLPHS